MDFSCPKLDKSKKNCYMPWREVGLSWRGEISWGALLAVHRDIRSPMGTTFYESFRSAERNGGPVERG